MREEEQSELRSENAGEYPKGTIAKVGNEKLIIVSFEKEILPSNDFFSS